MKIAIISHSHYPIKQPFAGGLEAHTYSLTQQLQKAGHEVRLYAAIGSDETLPCVPFFRPTALELFKPEKGIVSYRERRYLSLMRHLKKGSFDLIHNNSLHYLPLKLAASLPIPMVTVLHTPPFPNLVQGFRSSLKASHHRVIAISQSVAADWQRVIPELKPQLIYNGIDTNQWFPRQNAQPHAVWCGRITPEKGTHLAIAAANEAQIPIRICGPIHHADYFAQQVKPLLSDRAQYLGSLCAADLSQEVAQASVFVCTPCWDEPFGLVAAEALASGTPVAGFDRGALSEIVTPTTGVLVPPDVSALAKAIRQAQQLSRQQCRQRAVRHFSIQAMVQGYTQLYNRLLSDRTLAVTPTLSLVS